MADARLRDLERQALTDPEARAEWILCQLRRDAFPPYRVELCARLGDDAARAAMNLPGRARLDLQLGRSLAEHGTDLTCRVALAAGAAATRAEGDESALRALNEVLSIAHQLYRERTKRGAKALAVAITTASRLRTRHKGAEAVRTAGHAVCLEPRSNAIWQSWYAGRSLEAAIEAPRDPADHRGRGRALGAGPGRSARDRDRAAEPPGEGAESGGAIVLVDGDLRQVDRGRTTEDGRPRTGTDDRGRGPRTDDRGRTTEDGRPRTETDDGDRGRGPRTETEDGRPRTETDDGDRRRRPRTGDQEPEPETGTGAGDRGPRTGDRSRSRRPEPEPETGGTGTEDRRPEPETGTGAGDRDRDRDRSRSRSRSR